MHNLQTSYVSLTLDALKFNSQSSADLKLDVMYSSTSTEPSATHSANLSLTLSMSLEQLFGLAKQVAEPVRVSFHDRRKNRACLASSICHAPEVVGDGQEPFELREVLHSNFFDGRPEL